MVVEVNKESYEDRGLTAPRRAGETKEILALADTGAQMVVLSPNVARSLGVRDNELLKASMQIQVANGVTQAAMGMLILKISYTDRKGKNRTTWQQSYILEGAGEGLFLCQDTLDNLGCVKPDFPEPGDAHAIGNPEGEEEDQDENEKPCDCPDRGPVPEPPTSLPYEAVEENIEKLKEWIINHYKASAFNTCTHQRMPLVHSSPPLRLHLDKSMKPVVCHKAGNVLVHFQAEVKAGLDRDVRIGVLRKVPVNNPVKSFCSRMCIATKKTGKPRRTVDFKALNRACPRQTHAVEPPFWQANGIPAGTWKTCLDAKEGYHSIPIHKDDWKHTQFITPWGRYEYMVTPQGFLAAGDGYCHRYDEITRDFPDYKRCVDDTCLWSQLIEGNFNRTCKYLTLCAKNGIIFNLEKLQFCKREVEFVGYQITDSGMKPTEDMLASILAFPRPQDISGVRGFFGLVEQVAWAFVKTRVMDPFRELLKGGTTFLWTQELEIAFSRAKEKIVDLVKEGVKSFDVGRTTCVNTNWSKTGIAFALLQKHCKCKDINLRCCREGWKLCYTSSRFCNGAESRYAPIEGEALAVAWALDKAKHYVMGCPNLYVGVDHKPLLGVYSPTKALADIENPRLRNLAEKATRYRFTTFHVKGAEKNLPDTMSRYLMGGVATMGALERAATKNNPAAGWMALAGYNMTQPNEEDIKESNDREAEVEMAARTALDELDEGSVAAIGPRVLTWERLKTEALNSAPYQELTEAIKGTAEAWPENLKHLKRFREEFMVVEDVALYKDRPIIPEPLRPEVLATLHSGHQGVTSMWARASTSVWWPGMWDDISWVRA